VTSGSSVAPPRSSADLHDYSAEHLYYELTMLYATVEQLKGNSHPSRDGAVTGDPVNIVVTNALIESFATHARAVALFLYPEATSRRGR
jgi:hypothetical protein